MRRESLRWWEEWKGWIWLDGGLVDKEKGTKWRVTRKHTWESGIIRWKAKAAGKERRGKGTDTERRSLSRISFFFLLAGLHANTLERIVQLRELKKCIIQVRQGWRRMGRGDGKSGRKGKVQQKDRAEKKYKRRSENPNPRMQRGNRNITQETLVTSVINGTAAAVSVIAEISREVRQKHQRTAGEV